jgi:hypothetical protein
MQLTFARTLIPGLAAVIMALPISAFPASAAPTSATPQLDDAVVQRLQTASDSSLIPVIVEGALSSTITNNGPRARQRRACRG